MFSYVVNSSTPSKIWPAGNKQSLLLTNTDSFNSVYLSDEPSGGGYPLGPGASVSWDGGRALYACVDDGSEVRLNALANGGSLFAPDAIASALVRSGLDDLIALRLNLLGVPPIDANAVLLDTTVNMAGGAVYRSDPLFVSRYPSLIVFVFDSYAGKQERTVTVSSGNEITGSLIGLSETSFNVLSQNGAVLYPGTHATVVTPTRAAYVDLTVSAAANVSDVRLIVIGSYKSVAKTTYQHINHEWITDLPAGATAFGRGSNGLAGFSWPTPATGARLWLPVLHAGRWQYTLEASGTNAYTVSWTLVDSTASVTLLPVQTLTGPGGLSRGGEIIIPAMPVHHYINVAISPSQYMRVTLTSEPY